MHEYPIEQLAQEYLFKHFHVCEPVPKQLRFRGTFPSGDHLKFLAIVGARNHTLYGKIVCEQLIAGLAGYPVVIISGLAHGIDSVAHTTALDHGLTCIAFPGSGLHESVIYPQKNFNLAQKILHSGGCLMSEYDIYQKTAPWIFPMRNRLIAGCADATLVIECTNQSGTRITARLATDYNRDVLAVPGPVTSELSEGPNELIKLGAVPITSSDDILHTLGITPRTREASNTSCAGINPDTITKPFSQQNSLLQKRLLQKPLPQKPMKQNVLFEIVTPTSEHQLILSTVTHPIHKSELLALLPAIKPASLDVSLSELELMNKIKVILGVIYKQ